MHTGDGGNAQTGGQTGVTTHRPALAHRRDAHRLLGGDRRVKRLAFASLLVPALALGGCRCSRSGDDGSDPQANASASARPPVDRLAPGELAEGPTSAFGLMFPQKMRLERRFLDSAHAAGPVPPEAVANYVRQRVEATHVEIGAARTVFPRVRIKGGAPDKLYRIEVVANGANTLLVLRDVTPPPLEPGLSNEERWKRAGMTPEGKPLDPKKME